MTGWDQIEAAIGAPGASAESFLKASEAVLENWIAARGQQPTQQRREGFRLLALHRQGSFREPSFNACRETCREIAYHYNLLKDDGPEAGSTQRLLMMGILANHVMLFVRGKMEVAGLGEFCCASKSIRAADTIARFTNTGD